MKETTPKIISGKKMLTLNLDLIKLNSQMIAQILAIILHQSLREGCFPTAMKKEKEFSICEGEVFCL